MFVKSFFLLSLLQAATPNEWQAVIQQEATVPRGLCARIQCHYSCPPHLARRPRDGVWFNTADLSDRSNIAFHSKDRNHAAPRYRQRTRLSGNLTEGNCSLVIDNVTKEDEGPYYFRIEFGRGDQYSYSTVAQLHVNESGQRWADTPGVVRAQRGLCAQIPCPYSSPTRPDKKARVGIWMRDECMTQTVVFHSTGHDSESPWFRRRTRLSGDLEDGDCSLVIDNVTQQDEGHYYFNIEFGKADQYIYVPTTQLQVTATASAEWRTDVNETVTAQRGLCAWIPCRYSHPPCLAGEARTGIWVKDVNWSLQSVAFQSTDHDQESPRVRRRTWLSGDLKAGDCSLVISNVTQEDEGPYYFRIKFKNRDVYSYPSVTRLQVSALASENWRADTPRDVTAQRGLCARVPCRYSYPPNLDKAARVGIWVRDECTDRPVAFHSGNPDGASPRFRNRTRLSGHLEDGNCSLVIDDIVPEDEEHYYFRIEFESPNQYSYVPTTQLHVTDFTDKPSIFPAEMVAGKPRNISCTFSTTCDGTAPNLTWVTPANVTPSVSSSVTQRGDTLTYTSVLTLTPELKHHGQNLTCRVTYPSVSSERTLTLTVQPGQPLQEVLVISLAAAAGAVILIASSVVICLTLRSRQRTERPAGSAGKPGPRDKSEMVSVGPSMRREKHYKTHCAQPVMAQEKYPENKPSVNQYQDHDLYVNCHLVEESVYANV